MSIAFNDSDLCSTILQKSLLQLSRRYRRHSLFIILGNEESVLKQKTARALLPVLKNKLSDYTKCC